MSHTTHVKDETGREWVITHNSDWSGDAYIKPRGDNCAGLPVPGFIIKNACRAVLAEELTTLVQDTVEFALSAWQGEASRSSETRDSLANVRSDVAKARDLLLNACGALTTNPAANEDLNIAKAQISSAITFIDAAMSRDA